MPIEALKSSPIPETAGASPSKLDWAIILVLVLLGIFQVMTARQLEDYGGDSSVYMGLAHNLLETGRYEFDFKPHTVYPPGFPVLLAAITAVTGHEGYGLFIRFMPAFATLGLLAWYFVLKRCYGPYTAGACCLIAATAPALYEFASRNVLSDLPYFMMSGVAFWALCRLREPLSGRFQSVLLNIGFCVAVVGTVLLRSVGVAICVALVVWVVSERWRGGAPLRVKRSVIAVSLAGFLAVSSWIMWAKAMEQQDHSGIKTRSYASWLLVKDPQRPELGNAAAGELVLRLASSVPLQIGYITTLLTRLSYVMPTWYSPFAIVVLALLLCGVVSSAYDRWGWLLTLYFLGYFTIYSLWPFDEGPRFMLPVAPLAFALIVRGIQAIGRLWKDRAPATLAVVAATSAICTVVTLTAHRIDGMQARLALVFWPSTAIVAGLLALWTLYGKSAKSPRILDLFGSVIRSQSLGYVLIGLLAAAGLMQQVSAAKENANVTPSQLRHNSSADFASWLKGEPEGVALAHQYAIVHRLSGRKVVDFPVTTDPNTIMNVVRTEKVRYFAVNDHTADEYGELTEEERWKLFDSAFPSAFHLVRTGPGYRVFEVAALGQ